MLLAFFVVAFAIAGHAATEALYARAGASDANDARARSLLERALGSGVATIALVTATNWSLAFVHWLNARALVIAAVVAGAAGALVLRRLRGRAANAPSRATPRVLLFFLLPVVAWIAFVAWRGAILPVLSHDGLNYHMPKAVFFVRAAGLEEYAASNIRIAAFPNDYELLLADVLLLTRSDAITEWVGTAGYIAFIVASAATVERWWGRGPHALATALVVAGLPIALYHSGAHKNDLMTVALTVSAALFVARFVAVGDAASAALAILSIALAAGTKFLGLVLACAVVVVLVVVALSRRWPRTLGRPAIVGLALLALVAAPLLGSASYVENLRRFQSLVGPPGEGVMHPGWGAFAQLWMFPILAWLVPFARFDDSVWVPWRGEYWWWPANDLFFSHFGALVSVAVLAIVPCVMRYGRAGTPEQRLERRVATSILVLEVALFLPTHNGPLGFFDSYARYLQFIVVPIAGWTIAPVVRELWTRGARVATYGAMAVLAVVFVLGAQHAATHDPYIPPTYLEAARRTPGIRYVPVAPSRAGSVVDTMAGPNDLVAVDGDFDTNLYPVFGADLSRRVVFVHAASEVPEGARWVIVDRSWNAVWNDPRFVDMGRARELLFHGKLTADDVRVFDELRRDARFALRYRDERLNQAVFERVGD
jgi:hypothetical protein